MRIAPALLVAVLVACGSVEPVPEQSQPIDPAAAPPGASPSSPSPPAPAPGPTPAPSPSSPAQPPALTAAECFKDLQGSVKGPDYDKVKPTLAPSCAGTHHQTITGVEKVVFLGDSITVGTPPTIND